MADQTDPSVVLDDDEEDNGTFDAERAKAKIARANSEAANLRKRLKEAEAKAARLDEIENAGKSETERLTAAVAEAERRAQEADARALRLEVAAAKGLNPTQARRLVGTTPEELEADADELLASFKPADDQPARPPGRPTEALRGGGDPTQEPPVDVRKVVDAIPRGL